MPETKSEGARSWKRFQVILMISVLVPCLLLGYLAVHVLRIREAQMMDMAHSRTLATAQMAVSAVEESLRSQVSEIRMDAMKLELDPSAPPRNVLEGYLANHPLARAAFLFDSQGGLLSQAVSRRVGESEGGPLDPQLAQRIYAKIQSRRGEGEKAVLPERIGDSPALLVPTVLSRRPDTTARLLAVALDVGWLQQEVVEPVLRQRAEASGLRLRLSPQGQSTAAGGDAAAEAKFSPDFPFGRVTVSGVEEALRQSRDRDRVLLAVFLAVVYGAVIGGVLFSWRALKREWELTRLKAAFMANVSHELRTPLALIRMYAESLLLGRVSEEDKRAEYLRILVREAGRLTHLINNVLDFSDIESGRKAFDMKPGNLAELVQRVLADYGPHLSQASARLKSDIPDRFPDSLLDEGAVTQALLNLLDNAVKYSAGTPEIDVRVYADGHLSLEVEDRGPGIPPEKRARIFDPFYRVNPGLAPQGSGLGLALVRHVVEAHGGTVQVEDGAEGGSRFVIRLPRQADQEERS